MIIFIRDFIRTIVRNLGLFIILGLGITILVRGFNPIPETIGVVTASLIVLVMVGVHVYHAFSEVEEEVNPLVRRIAKLDVTISLLLLTYYIGGTSQLMM